MSVGFEAAAKLARQTTRCDSMRTRLFSRKQLPTPQTKSEKQVSGSSSHARNHHGLQLTDPSHSRSRQPKACRRVDLPELAILDTRRGSKVAAKIQTR